MRWSLSSYLKDFLVRKEPPQDQKIYEISGPQIGYENDTVARQDFNALRVTQDSGKFEEKQGSQRQPRYYELGSPFETMDCRKYQYEALPSASHIRLLVLEHGASSAPLKGRLDIVKLSQQCRYRALSYVWGNQQRCIEFNCDSTVLYITENLALALRALQRSNWPRYLWVDAICINQDDIQERSLQTSLMSQIYRRADHVVIWLGWSNELIAYSAFTFVKRIAERKSHLGSRNFNLLELRYAMNYDTADDPEKARQISNGNREEVNAIYAILQNPWYVHREVIGLLFTSIRHRFTRTWIVQEVAVSRRARLTCGYAVCEWTSFADVACWLYYSPKPGQSIRGHGPCQLLRDCCLANDEQESLRSINVHYPQFIEFFWNMRFLFSASDLRDSVYATLWHPSWPCQLDGTPYIIPDYTMSATDLFIKATLVFFTCWNRSEVLALASCQASGPEEFADLPSWAVRFDNEIVKTLYFFGTPWTAATSKPAEWEFKAPRTLMVKGVVLDVVHSCSRPFNRRGLAPHKKRSIQQPWPFLFGWLWNHKWFDNIPLALALTAGLDTLGNEETSIRTLQDFEQALTAFAWCIFSQNTPLTSPVTAQHVSTIDNLGQKASELLSAIEYDRLVFDTEFGRYGNGPVCTQPGDLVCAIFGSNVLLILRHTERREGNGYQVVGDCYMHGFMEGQAVEMIEKRELSTKSFCLI